MSTFLAFLRGLVLLVVRVGLGGVLLAHAWVRWHQGNGVQTAYFTQFGVPQANVMGWVALVLEAVAGVLLIAGFLTPVFALLVLIEQILLICYTTWYRAADLFSTNGTGVPFEQTLVLGLVAAVLVVYGAGPASMDRLFKRSPEDTEVEDTPPAATTKPVTPAGRSAIGRDENRTTNRVGSTV